ncbi:Xaa-Pro aminopeptidase [Bradyrhizobium sp. S3.2.12]
MDQFEHMVYFSRYRQAAEKAVCRSDFLDWREEVAIAESSERRQTRGFGDHFASFSTVKADSSDRCQEFGDANEVVGGRSRYKEPLHQVSASMARLAQPADGIDPAERLLDLLALNHADAIAGITSGARIDCRAAIGVVLRAMRHAATHATFADFSRDMWEMRQVKSPFELTYLQTAGEVADRSAAAGISDRDAYVAITSETLRNGG